MIHPHAESVEKLRADAGLRALGAAASRRRRDLPAKMTVHSTETPAGTGLSVIRQLAWPYTLIADPATRDLYQLGPLDGTALSLRGTHAKTGAKIETNHAGKHHPQVSIVGYASKMQDLSTEDLNWLADVVFEPTMRLTGVENVWARSYGADDGIVLASTDSAARMDLAACQTWPGVLYHQTWYGNDHWDPGKLDADYLTSRIGNSGLPRVPPNPGKPTALVLGFGDESRAVSDLQVELNRWFDAGLDVDGDFGKATQTAVLNAQRAIGVKADGYWGPVSAAALEAWIGDVAEAVVSGVPLWPESLSLASAALVQASADLGVVSERLLDAAAVIDTAVGQTQ